MKNLELSISEFAVPEAKETEYALISECVYESYHIREVRDVVSPIMFSDNNAKALWEEMLRMDERGEVIDLSTIIGKTDRNFFLNHIVSHGMGTTLSTRSHAEVVKEFYVRRQAYLVAIELLTKSNEASVRPTELLQIPTKFSENLSNSIETSNTQSIQEVINNLGDDLQKNDEIVIPTSFPSLDRIFCGGLQAGDLVILAARASCGKTAIMLQMARNASNYHPVFCCSLEMSCGQLGKRLLTSTHYVQQNRLINGNVDWEGFERASGEFSNKKLYFDDTTSTIDQVCSAIVTNHRRGKCDVAFIDYLGLIEDDSDKEDIVAISVAKKTRRLKKLAMSLKIPIVLLCQLNRASAKEDRPPELYDLRDSGAIEQDADKVILIERPKDPNDKTQFLPNKVTLWLRKNRNGMAGNLCLNLSVDDIYSNFSEE